MENRKQLAITIILALFCSIYLFVFFPLAFFRHDDWMNLGNSLMMKDDWTQVFSSSFIYEGGEPGTWFFRPLFKGLYLLFYSLFGLNYYPWLVFQLILTLFSVILAQKTIVLSTGNRINSYLFTTLFCPALLIHIGSILWTGEGLMNCPQVFLLALSTLFFLKGGVASRPKQSSLFFGGALFAYMVSLLFKESTVVHTAFLFAFVFSEYPFQTRPFKTKLLYLSPYAAITGFYLVSRFLWLPLNEGYQPTFPYGFLKSNLFSLLATLFLSPLVASMFLVFVKKIKGKEVISLLSKKWLYIPFIVLSLIPYIGQGFFSPGWLLLPGFFILLTFSLIRFDYSWSARSMAFLASTVFLVFSIPLFHQIQRMGWWHWQKSQKEIIMILKNLDPQSTQKIFLYEQPNQAYPAANISRVLGGNHAFFHMWHILHPKHQVQFFFRKSDDYNKTESSPGEVHIRWNFPEWEVIFGAGLNPLVQE